MMGIPGGVVANICKGGCAMSSVAMALAGYNITIDGEVPTPKNLNNWLKKNDGYHCISGICYNLVLDAPDRISPGHVKSLGEPPVPFLDSLVRLVKSNFVVIAHVKDQHHFVLVTGFQAPNIFTILDPFYPQTTYQYEEIHDILLYDMN